MPSNHRVSVLSRGLKSPAPRSKEARPDHMGVVAWSGKPNLADLRGRSPAGTCRPTHADRCARLRQLILLPVLPFCSIRRSQRPCCEPPNRACVKAAPTDGSIPKRQCRPLSPPGCRLPPNSPPNPTFDLLAEYRGLPVTRSTQHLLRRADLKFRCIGSHAASPARRSAGETPSRPVAARRESPF